MPLKLFRGLITIGKDINAYSGRSDDFYAVMEQKYGVDYAVRHRLKAYKNVVYACTSLIGEQCGGYSPRIQQRKGDQWEDIDHEFLRLLRRPGGRELKAASFSMFDLWEATSIYQLLQGDCFWYMGRGVETGKPREIVLLRPDRVGTDINKDTGEVDGYFIRQAAGPPIPLAIEEVLRFPFFNPENPYKGLGVVEAGNDYIATDENSATYVKNFFGNNAGISGVLNIKGEVTKGAFRKFVRAWRDKYEGVDNAGKVAILRDSDAAFTKVGLGLDELDMSNLRKMSLADVHMMFKVPPELLGKITDGSGLGRGNIETLEYIFTKYNIEAKFKRFDAVLQFALERYWGTTDLRVSHENIIPEDKEFELSEREKGVDKWLKRNEVRDEEGLDPVDGGDQLFVPFANVPLSEAAGTAPVEAGKGIRVKITRKIQSPVTPNPADIALQVNTKEHFRLSLMRNQERYERKYKKVVKPVFKDQRTEALFNLEAHASSLTKAAEQKLFDDAAYDALLVKALTPMLTDLTKTQGGLALIFAGDSENEFHLTSQILANLQRGTQKMASNFNDETLTRLNGTLAEGIQNGEGLGDLKKRVNTVYDDIDGHRAERIARTETLKASNAATLDAYRQTGYVTAKGWSVNPGACPFCSEFDGKTVPLDEDFLGLGENYGYTNEAGEEITRTNDYDTVETPPLHPNCRCTIVPIYGQKAVDPELQKTIESLKTKNKDLKKTQADDRVYIKALENNIGVDSEPEAGN